MDDQLKYLSEALEILPPVGELQKVKCHLLYLQRWNLGAGNWTNQTLVSLSVCPHCFMDFRGTRLSVKVIPSKKPSRNVQKALVKEATSQNLTAVQRSLLAAYKEQRGKKLVIKCAICQKETVITLKKQKRDRSKRPSATTKESSTDSSQNKSQHHPKKKKKKDKFAGLKVNAVMALKSKKKKL